MGLTLRSVLTSMLLQPRPSRSRRPSPPATISIGARLRHLAARHLGMAVTLALLAGLCALQVLALLRAPAAWMPAAIHVTPVAGETVVLGLRELAAPHADRQHLALRLDPRDGWMLRNLSAAPGAGGRRAARPVPLVPAPPFRRQLA